jgi:hypothetical protein
MVSFMMFGLGWVILYIQYCSRYLVMCAASTYYFNSDVEDEGTAEVLLSIKMCHFY